MRRCTTAGIAALALLSTLLVGCEPNTAEPPPHAHTRAAAQPDATVGILAHFHYRADAGLLRACGEEAEYPVATEGDNASLERAYNERATKPAEKLLVRFEGNLIWQPQFDPTTGRVGEKQRAWYVERFLGLEPDNTCP